MDSSPGISESRFRRSLNFFGVGTILVGLLGLLLAGPVGRFVYYNVDILPGEVAEKIYVDFYSVEDYESVFLHWAAWPAFTIALVGSLALATAFLSPSTQSLIYRKRWVIGLGVIASVGALIRTRAYLQNRSLWLDEAFLAHSVRDRSLLELLGTPLDYGQSAPPGFLILVFLVTVVFGVSDLSLRFVPYLFGVALVYLAIPVANRLLSSNVARLVFVGFLSFSPVLIYYSHEFKQYSSDAFVTLFILWAWTKRDSWKSWWGIGLIGFLAVLMSLTAVFSLITFGLGLFVGAVTSGKGLKDGLRAIVLRLPSFLLWVAGGLIHLLYLSFGGTDRENMETWWSDNGGFPPREGLLASVEWVISSSGQLVWLALGHPGRAGPGMGSGVLLLSLIFLVAVSIVIITNFRKLMLPGTFVLVGFAVAAAGVYPFSSRLNIYLIPIVVLMLALVVEESKRGGKILRRALVVVPVIFGFVPLAIGLYLLAKPFDNWDTKWLLDEVQLSAQTGDVVVGVDQPIVNWYLPGGVLERLTLVDLESLERIIEETPSSQVWAFSTHYGLVAVDEALSGSHVYVCGYEIGGSLLQMYSPLASAGKSDFDCTPRIPKF